MNYSRSITTLYLVCLNTICLAQNPSDPVWGLYASGVGEPLKAGMDPCWITYTVGLMDDERIQENVTVGTMGPIETGLNWYEATALQRRFSRYFDDEPDGVFKLTPCEIIIPDISGTWYSKGRGYFSLQQKGKNFSGTAAASKPGDHWGKGHREGGSITGTISENGTITIRTQWGDGTYTEDQMRLNEDGDVISGTYNWYTDANKKNKKSSGSYSINR